MSKHVSDRLIKQYGQETINKAFEYFTNLGRHCIISELENKCKEILKNEDREH